MAFEKINYEKFDVLGHEQVNAMQDEIVKSSIHVDDQNNPHNVTADQVPVTEAVLNAIKETDNLSVDSVLTMFGNLMCGGSVLYLWSKSKYEVKQGYSNRQFSVWFPSGATTILYYSSEYQITDSGKLCLVNPESMTISYYDTSAINLKLLTSKYFTVEEGETTTLYKATSSTTVGTHEAGEDFENLAYIDFNSVYDYTVITTTSTVSSTDPNAHYDGEVDADGYTYTTLDPLSSFLPRIASGTYQGTGENTSTIAPPAEFAPKLLLIFGVKPSGDGVNSWHYGRTICIVSLDAESGWFYTGHGQDATSNLTKYGVGGLSVARASGNVSISCLPYYFGGNSSSGTFKLLSRDSLSLTAFNNAYYNYTYYFVG